MIILLVKNSYFKGYGIYIVIYIYMYYLKIINKVYIFSSIFCLLFMISYFIDSEFFKSIIKLYICSFNVVVL